MASETVDPIDWSLPPPHSRQYPLNPFCTITECLYKCDYLQPPGIDRSQSAIIFATCDRYPSYITLSLLSSHSSKTFLFSATTAQTSSLHTHFPFLLPAQTSHATYIISILFHYIYLNISHSISILLTSPPSTLHVFYACSPGMPILSHAYSVQSHSTYFSHPPSSWHFFFHIPLSVELPPKINQTFLHLLLYTHSNLTILHAFDLVTIIINASSRVQALQVQSYRGCLHQGTVTAGAKLPGLIAPGYSTAGAEAVGLLATGYRHCRGRGCRGC